MSGIIQVAVAIFCLFGLIILVIASFLAKYPEDWDYFLQRRPKC